MTTGAGRSNIMTPELVLSRATAGGPRGFAARYQGWFLRRGRWSRRLILMIFGAIAALAFAPVSALPLFAVGLVGIFIGPTLLAVGHALLLRWLAHDDSP